MASGTPAFRAFRGRRETAELKTQPPFIHGHHMYMNKHATPELARHTPYKAHQHHAVVGRLLVAQRSLPLPPHPQFCFNFFVAPLTHPPPTLTKKKRNQTNSQAKRPNKKNEHVRTTQKQQSSPSQNPNSDPQPCLIPKQSSQCKEWLRHHKPVPLLNPIHIPIKSSCLLLHQPILAPLVDRLASLSLGPLTLLLRLSLALTLWYPSNRSRSHSPRTNRRGDRSCNRSLSWLWVWRRRRDLRRGNRCLPWGTASSGRWGNRHGRD